MLLRVIENKCAVIDCERAQATYEIRVAIDFA